MFKLDDEEKTGLLGGLVLLRKNRAFGWTSIADVRHYYQSVTRIRSQAEHRTEHYQAGKNCMYSG